MAGAVVPVESSSSSSEDKIMRKKRVIEKSGNAAVYMTCRMVCGGLAGMIAKTATNPLERIKMLPQRETTALKTPLS